MDPAAARSLLSSNHSTANASVNERAANLEIRKRKMDLLLRNNQKPSTKVHFSLVEVEIVGAHGGHKLCTLERVANVSSISAVKELFQKKFPNYYPSRQSFRLSVRGKSLKDTDTLADLNLSNECTLYFKDLGPQIAWSSVFYCEYSGPLFIYLMFYLRLPFIYGSEYAFTSSPHEVVHIAAACHSFHYAKRLLETRFVHRFSHGTMPIGNLFKNSTYYWGFAAWIAYFINHPLYTVPMYGNIQIYSALALFLFGEIGNLSIHLSLKNLRPAGSTKRQVPRPTGNPFTWLFSLVSCPNYTYEVGAWICFAVMTQTLVGLFFAFVGFVQMTIWALGKHRNYVKEFKDYPRSRTSIVPFLI